MNYKVISDKTTRHRSIEVTGTWMQKPLNDCLTYTFNPPIILEDGDSLYIRMWADAKMSFGKDKQFFGPKIVTDINLV